MSAEVYGIVALAIVCILISPYYKTSQVHKKDTVVQKLRNPVTVKTENTKNIVLLSVRMMLKG